MNDLISRTKSLLWEGIVNSVILIELKKDNKKRIENFNNLLPLGLITSNTIDSLTSLCSARIVSINSMVLRNCYESSVTMRYLKDNPELMPDYYLFSNMVNERKKGKSNVDLVKEYPQFVDKKGKLIRYWHGKNTFKELSDCLAEKYPKSLFRYEEYFAAPSTFIHPSSNLINLFLNNKGLLDYTFSGNFADFALLASSAHLVNSVRDFREALNVFDKDLDKKIFELQPMIEKMANSLRDTVVEK